MTGRDLDLEQAIADGVAAAYRLGYHEGLRAAARVALTQPFFPDTVTGKRQQWVKEQIAEAILKLTP